MVTVNEVLQKLVPLNTLSSKSLEEVSKIARIEQVASGTTLFLEGDRDNDSIFVLAGEVTLSSNMHPERVIHGGTDASKYALSQLKPRQSTGTVTHDATIARIDQEQLDHIITMDEVSGIEVVEMEADDDVEWIFNVLSSNTFSRLPPSNANEMLARMEKLPVRANQIIITQGEPGDYYYLIREGIASVAKRDAEGKTAIVNELHPGDQFGEEALLSDAPRNATIMMKTDGILMRLTREDFNELLTAPMVHWAEQLDADHMIGEGAGILDVRTPDEYLSGAINKSLNVPLSQIRQYADKLDRNRKYVIYCQTGNRSAVASFMLNQRGFDTVALKGGLMSLTLIPNENASLQDTDQS
jgi:CRP-like cAMP-binding protein